MPRYSGVPIETELVTAPCITIPIERLDTTQNITSQFMAELISAPGPGVQDQEQFTKNFLSQLMEGSLTQPGAQQAHTVWDSAPIQPRKPCKKPQDQAEWEAILNANLAGMAENEEEFTKGFLANLTGGSKEGRNAPTAMPRGGYGKSIPEGMRAATPPGLRSVPKAPTCWGCSEPVEMGMRIIKVKGYPMHPECFVCTACFVPLKASNVFISNDRLFCREHIKFGPKSIRPLSRGQTPEITEF
jgi:hypothetical protein